MYTSHTQKKHNRNPTNIPLRASLSDATTDDIEILERTLTKLKLRQKIKQITFSELPRLQAQLRTLEDEDDDLGKDPGKDLGKVRSKNFHGMISNPEEDDKEEQEAYEAALATFMNHKEPHNDDDDDVEFEAALNHFLDYSSEIQDAIQHFFQYSDGPKLDRYIELIRAKQKERSSSSSVSSSSSSSPSSSSSSSSSSSLSSSSVSSSPSSSKMEIGAIMHDKQRPQLGVSQLSHQGNIHNIKFEQNLLKFQTIHRGTDNKLDGKFMTTKIQRGFELNNGKKI